MDFKTAVNTCLVNKYCNFSGRASKSEFWWFCLAQIIIYFVAGFIGGLLLRDNAYILSSLVSLALLLPALGAGCRRLHDTNKSGWWQLIAFIPVIGIIILIIFWIKDPVEPNNY